MIPNDFHRKVHIKKWWWFSIHRKHMKTYFFFPQFWVLFCANMFQWKSGWSPTTILWFGSPDLNDLRSHICSKLAWAWVNMSSLQRILEYRVLFPWFSMYIYIYILTILGICFLNCCIILILCVHRILRPCFCWKKTAFFEIFRLEKPPALGTRVHGEARCCLDLDGASQVTDD